MNINENSIGILCYDDSNTGGILLAGAEEKSKQLAGFFQEVADKQKCEFINMTQYIQPSLIDGCHLEKEAHVKVAEVLEEKIKTIFNF